VAQRRILAIPDSDEAATAVEYAIMVALIAAVIVAIIVTLGLQTAGLYEGTSTNLNEATSE
jgi:Flp pilus assembly pilin Flp